MDPSIEQHPYSDELKRVRQLSESHDEMKRVLDGVLRPAFNEIINVFVGLSFPNDINLHSQGVILNFGRPNKPFTIAFYGYPEDREFELAVSTDHETTRTCRIPFQVMSPGKVKLMFEEFIREHVPDVNYRASYDDHEVYDLGHEGPYQLRIEDEGATSVVATVDEFSRVLDMASVIQESFDEKNLIITDKNGDLVC